MQHRLDTMQTRGAPHKQGRAPAQAIYASLEQDFPDDEDAWDLRARRHLGPHAPPASAGAAPSGGHGAVVGAYEAAVAALPTPRMYDAYGAYLAECLDALAPAESAAEGGPPGRLRGPARAAARALVQLYERAAAAGAASEAALLAWPRLLLRCGKAAAALAAAEAASGAAPRSAALWRQRLLLHAQHAAAQARSAGLPLTRCRVQVPRMHSVHAVQHSPLVARAGGVQGGGAAPATEQLGALMRSAVRAVPGADSAELWGLAFRTLQGLGLPLLGLARELEAALAALPKGPLRVRRRAIAARSCLTRMLVNLSVGRFPSAGSLTLTCLAGSMMKGQPLAADQGGFGTAAAAALAAVHERHGLSEARALYGRLLALPPAGGVLFHAVLDLEMAAPAAERLRRRELGAVFEVCAWSVPLLRLTGESQSLPASAVRSRRVCRRLWMPMAARTRSCGCAMRAGSSQAGGAWARSTGGPPKRCLIHRILCSSCLPSSRATERPSTVETV
jgi:hypothetical protein